MLLPCLLYVLDRLSGDQLAHSKIKCGIASVLTAAKLLYTLDRLSGDQLAHSKN